MRKIGAEGDTQGQYQDGETEGEVSVQPGDDRQRPRQVDLACCKQGKEGISKDAHHDANDEDAPHPDNQMPEQSQEGNEVGAHAHPYDRRAFRLLLRCHLLHVHRICPISLQKILPFTSIHLLYMI